MDNFEDMGKLFFELASENRFSILHILLDDQLKMQEIANKLDVTATEAFRQLQRLNDVKLVQRLPEGAYSITPYGKLVLHLSTSFQFTSKHRDYFLTHNIWGIPVPLINRLAELSGAELVMDAVASTSRCVKIFMEAKEYAWGTGVSGGGPDHLDSLMTTQIQSGIDFKLIVPEDFLSDAQAGVEVPNIQVRGASNLPAFTVLSEKEAAVFFPLHEGRVDYAGFIGDDPRFLAWVHDLFEHFWSSSKV